MLKNESPSTVALRQKIRSYWRENKSLTRHLEADSFRFGLGEIQSKIEELENLKGKDVQELADKIASRGRASAEDMYRLSHAFLQNMENIRIFAETAGAIEALVKELTDSKDAEVQLYAIETICNLTLGEPPVCEKVASLAGNYLLMFLDFSEGPLKRTCLWTMANIMATGGKGAQTMISLKIVPKVISLYLAEFLECDYHEDAAIILDIILSQGYQLGADDLEGLFKKFHMKTPISAANDYHLKLIFQAGFIDPSVKLSKEQLGNLIDHSLMNLTDLEDFEGTLVRMKVLYAIRVLSNLIALDPAHLKFLHQEVTLCGTNLVPILNKLLGFKNSNLNFEILRLVKNILMCQVEEFSASNFVANLNIPTGSLPRLETIN